MDEEDENEDDSDSETSNYNDTSKVTKKAEE